VLEGGEEERELAGRPGSSDRFMVGLEAELKRDSLTSCTLWLSGVPSCVYFLTAGR
jgi:hypothetical protein